MENLNENPIKHLAVTSLLIIALAFLDMPYGFYTFLRIFLFITSIFYLYNTPKDSPLFLLSWLICAIIYNPIIPLELRRSEWQLVNICTMAYIIFWIWKNLDESKRCFFLENREIWTLIIIAIFSVIIFS